MNAPNEKTGPWPERRAGSEKECGPLSGLRVLDLTAALAGPAATQRLGDWGADVIKVEPPGGEWSRTHPIVNAWLDGETTVFLSLNRNKRSIALDLKSDGDRDVIFRLAAGADVFVHNFRPGVVERLGLSPERLRAENARLVYGFVSGYGSIGPDSRRPGQDLLLQAYAGVMFSVGAETDRPQPGPIFAADVLASHLLAEAILAALLRREHTGEGQIVEVSMLGVLLDAQLQELVTFLNLGKAPTRGEEPYAHALLNPPYGIYSTADGWLAIAMADPMALGKAVGSDTIRELGTWEAAAENRKLIFEELSRLLPSAATREWMVRFDQEGIWSGPVHQYGDLLDLEQIAACGYFEEVPLPSGGSFRSPGRAATFSASSAPQHHHPPRLDADRDEILDSLRPNADLPHAPTGGSRMVD